MHKSIVFFDGVCNLCNGTVQFLLKIDKHQRLQFGSLQGESAKRILPTYQISPEKLSSIIFIHQNKVYTESSAVLEIFSVIGGPWTTLYIFKLIPSYIRNGIYRIVARYRYKWFGKRSSCRVPTPSERERFLN
jgi:predicted DCC family thiol-disulfide oxidoreductase YuxK